MVTVQGRISIKGNAIVSNCRYHIIAAMLVIISCMCGCMGYNESDKTTVTLFAATSLGASMDEIIDIYEESHPTVTIQRNYDSSGTLATQIAEGGTQCDIFFSASAKQMDRLDDEGLIVPSTRTNILSNKLCVVTYPGSSTKVTGLKDMSMATSLAIAGESVPAGDYTRKALLNIGIIRASEETSGITSDEISKALGGVEINECSNVGAVVTAISEHSNEVGTVYYSDIYGRVDRLEIIEMIPTELTGEIVYPAAQVKCSITDVAREQAAREFLEYLSSDEAGRIFEKHQFELVNQNSVEN